MNPQYEALFTPWKVGNVEIKNRIVMCPMGGTSLFGWFELGGCHFDKEAAKLFLERANNNVGLIIPGIAPLRDTFWGKWLWQNPKMFDELKVFMDEIHKTGAKLFIQLTAGMGRSWAITELVGPLHKNKFTRKLIKPILNYILFYSCYLRPFSNCFCLSICGNKPASACVPLLFRKCNPLTIARAIIFINVFSLQC